MGVESEFTTSGNHDNRRRSALGTKRPEVDARRVLIQEKVASEAGHNLNEGSVARLTRHVIDSQVRCTLKKRFHDAQQRARFQDFPHYLANFVKRSITGSYATASASAALSRPTPLKESHAMHSDSVRSSSLPQCTAKSLVFTRAVARSSGIAYLAWAGRIWGDNHACEAVHDNSCQRWRRSRGCAHRTAAGQECAC